MMAQLRKSAFRSHKYMVIMFMHLNLTLVCLMINKSRKVQISFETKRKQNLFSDGCVPKA